MPSAWTALVPHRTRAALLIALAAFVAVTTLRTHPSPAVTAALGGFIASMLSLGWLTSLPSRIRPALLAMGVLMSALLVYAQPNGPGFLGVFPTVSSAALMLETGQSAAVLAISLVSLPAAWTLRTGHPNLQGILQVNFGVVGFFLVATVARRFHEGGVEKEALLAELSETRAAHAQAAALGERQRLAREMHDVLAHTLSGLVLNLEGARMLAARRQDPESLEATLDRAHGLAKTGLVEARRAIGMLRDDDLPGPERLPGLAAEFQTDTGVACSVETAGEARELGPEARLTLYRVAQEALTNIRKHAQAERVVLALTYGTGATSLVITDWETGHCPSTGHGSGYGIAGMRERAALLGGSLEAGPTPDGFRVALQVPR